MYGFWYPQRTQRSLRGSTWALEVWVQGFRVKAFYITIVPTGSTCTTMMELSPKRRSLLWLLTTQFHSSRIYGPSWVVSAEQRQNTSKNEQIHEQIYVDMLHIIHTLCNYADRHAYPMMLGYV